MILGHAKFEEHQLRFVDLEHEDPNIERAKCILTTGKTIQKVTRAIIATGKYKAQQLLSDVVDKESGFTLFNIPLEVNAMASADEKMYVWNKIQQLAAVYHEIIPFEDELPVMTEEKQEVVVESKPEESCAQEMTPPEPARAPIAQELGEIDLNVMECLNALFEHVSLGGQDIGKSLSKYEKFTMHTGSGDLQIYPTNRIPEQDEGFKLSFKDFLVLLKSGIQINAGTITMEQRNGSSVAS